MPQRIILTGTPVSQIRKIKGDYLFEIGLGALKKGRNIRVYAFEMEEGGEQNPPKGLPKASSVQFTVFVNEEQLKKAEIYGYTKIIDRIRVEGEIVLDVPVDYCPGEIGVVAKSFSIVPPRKARKFGDYTIASKPIDVDIEKIVINDYMANLPLSDGKIAHARNYAKKHMTIETPLVVVRRNNHLVEGYAEYLAAREFGIKTVPVIFIGKKEDFLTGSGPTDIEGEK